MNKQKLKIIISYILVILWMIVIFMFSNVDSYHSNSTSKGAINKVVDKVDEGAVNVGIKDKPLNTLEKQNIVNEINLPVRKIIHFTEYLILCLLWINALRVSNIKYKYIISILICIIYAFTDEYHQTFINGRTGQLLDVLIDSSGVIVGSIIYYIGSKIFKKVSKK